MHKKAEYSITLVIITILIASTLTEPVKAHLDPPSNPKIKVEVWVTSITLLSDQDDGGGDAEIVAILHTAQKNHDNNSIMIRIDDFDWDDGPTRIIDKKIYEHEECSPLSDITLYAEVMEEDQDIITDLLVGGFTIIATIGGIVAAVPSAGASVAITAAVLGGTSAFTAVGISLNTNDDLGKGSNTYNTIGAKTINTGHVKVNYEIITKELGNDPECNAEFDLNVDNDVINPCDTVTATASTDDPAIKSVTFNWFNPAGVVVSANTDNEAPFMDSRSICEAGTWSVMAVFPDGFTVKKKILVKFMVLPESSLGAIAGLGVSITVLGLFYAWKRYR